MTPPVPPPAAVQIMLDAVDAVPPGAPLDAVALATYKALADAGLLDPDARLRKAVAALRAKTDRHGGVPWLEPELSAVFAALDAAPAETDQEAPTDA